MTKSDQSLGVVLDMPIHRHGGAVWVHVAGGRVIERLAARCEGELLLCAPCSDGPPEPDADYRLTAANLRIVPQPYWNSSAQALMHPGGILRAYAALCRQARAVFVRGMCPFVFSLYVAAAWNRCRVCHWIVGDAAACIRSNPRANWLADRLGLVYAALNRFACRAGRVLVQGAFLCNGEALGRQFRSARTRVVASSIVSEEDFFERQDTCQGPTVEILYVGFVRPEKGIEYLLEALASARLRRPWRLTLVGRQDGYPAYRERLEALIATRRLGERVRWAGYVPYGPKLLEYYRAADLLVLPSLSEGTPHVLVEARANGVPVIATGVGGIPTTVRHGLDGMLVPPYDSGAIAAALGRVIDDGELRRGLIRRGLESARLLTVSRFAAAACDLLTEAA
jgi:glycosyltransferase involved in cell wall biosynthesis